MSDRCSRVGDRRGGVQDTPWLYPPFGAQLFSWFWEKFYLAGALDVRTGRLETVGDFRKDSKLFGQLLFRLAARYRAARSVHVVLDNYRIHRSDLVKRILAELCGKIVLHFLPA